MRFLLLFSRGIYSRGFALALMVGGLAVLSTRAELSPAAYKEMQDAAPEQLVLKVTSVKLTPGKDGQQVDAQATVVDVPRTATKLKTGATIALSYAHSQLPTGMVGPGPVPIVTENTTYTAFLEGGPPPAPYMPAARGQSFIAMEKTGIPNAAVDADSAKNHDFVPVSLLSLGNLPKELLAGVQLTKQNGRWFAKVSANTTAVPLLAGGETPPALIEIAPLLLLDSMARLAGLSPESQKEALSPLLNAVAELMRSGDSPIVLVYRAGTAPLNGVTLTVERAVIYVKNGDNLKPLGDALWAVRAADGKPVAQQPIWHLSTGKLSVDNPFEKTAQEISLTPKPAAK
jgi:hypothetical protein